MNMSPCSARHDTLDGCISNCVFRSEKRKRTNLMPTVNPRFSRLIFSANQAHIFFREFRLIVLGTLIMSTFLNHICHIVRQCSKKQVIWSDASPVIASMQNAHPRPRFAKMDNPRSFVWPHLPLLRNGKFNMSIPSARQTSKPQPATFRLLNMRPERLIDSHWFSTTFCHVLNINHRSYGLCL
jgi:hypothetical protein